LWVEALARFNALVGRSAGASTCWWVEALTRFTRFTCFTRFTRFAVLFG